MTKAIDKLITEALAIEAEEAQEAGAIGFMARGLVQATMPHKKLSETHHERINGNYRLIMTALNPKIGLPYGSTPRLLLAWIGTEAIRTKERQLALGDSLSEFMRKLDMIPTGGRWGTITRLKNQSRRLFGAAIQCSYSTNDRDAASNFFIADETDLWWSPKSPEQASIFNSTVTLSRRFYDEIVQHPVPVDMRALKILKQSPLALDIYCWLTYRMSYLQRPTTIPWELLQAQFGSGYAFTPRGKLDFKRAFNRQLKKVVLVYPQANIEQTKAGFVMKPSRTHITGRKPKLIK